MKIAPFINGLGKSRSKNPLGSLDKEALSPRTSLIYARLKRTLTMKKLILSLLTVTNVFATASVPDQAPVAPLEQNPEVEKQVTGDYSEMERQESYPLGAIQKAWDRAEEGSGVYRAIYRPSEVIKFRVREFMATTLVFPKWEHISDVIIGDPASYDVTVIKPHVLSVKAKDNIGVDSSITLVGASGRVYSFYVRTEGYNSHNISDVAVYIKVPTGGPDPSKPLDAKEAKHNKDDYLEEAYFDPSQISFAFSMAGDKSIAPERVYSDGIRTWFDFGKRLVRQNLPTIYKVEDGVDTPLNVAREGTKVVAQAAGTFTLKHGKKTVCVLPSEKGAKE